VTKIKEHILRARTAMEKKPSIGKGDKSSITTLQKDLICVTEEGPWTIKCDMPEAVGGTETAPHAGTLLRAALGTCLATGYAMWAAQLDVPVENIQVTVTVTYDDGAALGANDNPAGFSKVKYHVGITSNAIEEDILRVLDTADAHSTLLDVFTRDQNCVREISLAVT